MSLRWPCLKPATTKFMARTIEKRAKKCSGRTPRGVVGGHPIHGRDALRFRCRQLRCHAKQAHGAQGEQGTGEVPPPDGHVVMVPRTTRLWHCLLPRPADSGQGGWRLRHRLATPVGALDAADRPWMMIRAAEGRTPRHCRVIFLVSVRVVAVARAAPQRRPQPPRAACGALI